VTGPLLCKERGGRGELVESAPLVSIKPKGRTCKSEEWGHGCAAYALRINEGGVRRDRTKSNAMGHKEVAS